MRCCLRPWRGWSGWHRLARVWKSGRNHRISPACSSVARWAFRLARCARMASSLAVGDRPKASATAASRLSWNCRSTVTRPCSWMVCSLGSRGVPARNFSRTLYRLVIVSFGCWACRCFRCASRDSANWRMRIRCPSVTAGKGNFSRQSEWLYVESLPTPSQPPTRLAKNDVNARGKHPEVEGVVEREDEHLCFRENRDIKELERAVPSGA